MGGIYCTYVGVIWLSFVNQNRVGLSEKEIQGSPKLQIWDWSFGWEKNQSCFFWENAFRVFSFEIGCCGILSKKIASIGVWGNGRLPQLNLPSALAVAKQGYSFLFAYWNVLIDFMKSRCHYTWLIYFASIFKINLDCNAMASAFREINYRYRSGK